MSPPLTEEAPLFLFKVLLLCLTLRTVTQAEVDKQTHIVDRHYSDAEFH
jgi:hypothetical protein